MKALKVKSRDAEKAKSLLMQKELYDQNYKVKSTKDHVFFPVKKEFSTGLGEVVDADLEERRRKHTYRDFLDLSEDEEDLLPSSYDVMGGIAIIDIPEGLEHMEKDIGEALIKAHSNITTVLKKTGIHHGEFRTQDLEWIAGKKTKETIYKENDVKLKLDVEKVYFSPRLSTERKRIYEQIKPGEKVLVMFSGCGPYPLTISKNTEASKVVGIEKNPVAHRYALENRQLNNLNNVEFIQGDVRKVVPDLEEKFDRIVMPLPKSAEDFLDVAVSAAKEGAMIHFYDFEHEDEFDRGIEKVKPYAEKIFQTVRCGQYSPGHYRICIDFKSVHVQ